MKKYPKLIHVLIAAMISGPILLAPAVLAQEDSADADERKARIVANLKLKFPQLEDVGVVVGDITATDFAGLDQGSFTIQGRPGGQQFLLSHDDTKLYLVSGEPIDVSLSAEKIAELVAEREAAKLKEAEEREATLAAAIEGRPVRGNPDAVVTIVKFSEFQCPYCTRGAATMAQLLEQYPDDVKYVFKHFPLDFHNWAKPAAIASYCAGEQDPEAFWTLHDKYFENQRTLTQENILPKSKEYLGGAGIDLEQWSTCAENTESEAYKAATAAVDADTALGKQLGVQGTPGFFVNGQFLKGAQPPAQFEPLIQKARGTAPPPPAKTDALP